MHYDYLIVGSGLFGATFAHFMTQQGRSCLVIDRRPHLGGNVHCALTAGINVHQYGAHIFHTDDRRVWEFANSLVPFNRYTNSPLANYHGRLYNLPFNMNTFYQIFGTATPHEAREAIDKERREVVEKLRAEGVEAPRNLEEQALTLVGRTIYETLVKEYTEKQWGRECRDLPAFIIRRLPVRFTYDNNYFNDGYQGIPVGGYNRLVEALLQKADTRTGEDYLAARRRYGDRSLDDGKVTLSTGDTVGYDTLLYTGALDEFFDYAYGRLNYRTVRFETEVKETPNWQGNAVVNYTSHDEPFTRIIEHKHFEAFGQAVYDNPRTVISREYSTEWQPGMEPYYPVNDERNNELFRRYKADADRCTEESRSRVLFGGRLADYKYYDMAPVMAKAWEMAKRESEK